jgi:hypothetical protein
MFSLIGILLLIASAASTATTSAIGLPVAVNIDLCWGGVLLIFGALMLIGAIRGGKKPPTA